MIRETLSQVKVVLEEMVVGEGIFKGGIRTRLPLDPKTVPTTKVTSGEFTIDKNESDRMGIRTSTSSTERTRSNGKILIRG